MKCRVLNTETDAIAAEAAISAAMGFAKPGVNAATGEVVPDALTVRSVPAGRIGTSVRTSRRVIRRMIRTRHKQAGKHHLDTGRICCIRASRMRGLPVPWVGGTA